MVLLETRVKEIEGSGVDHQVLSLPLPGTDLYERDFATKLRIWSSGGRRLSL